jgi:hypothetical protein
MDYPELNLLVGLGLAITLGVNLGLLVLIKRMDYPSALKILLSVLVSLGVIAAGYAFTLLFPSLSPTYRAILGLGMVLIAGLIILAVRWLSRVEFSGVLRVVFTVLLVAGLALNAWLVVVLYRSLVPGSAALSSPQPLSFNPYSHFLLAITVCLINVLS